MQAHAGPMSLCRTEPHGSHRRRHRGLNDRLSPDQRRHDAVELLRPGSPLAISSNPSRTALWELGGHGSGSVRRSTRPAW